MTTGKITKLPILAFNDVYRVTQKYNAPAGHAPRNVDGDSPAQTNGAATSSSKPQEQQYISVGQFAQTLYNVRNQWPERSVKDDEALGERGGEREGLVLFAGDVFNPSVESSITRGSHMVPILRELKLDAACVGNHDFDFGYAHLTTLMKSCTFPWLLSNIIDEKTSLNPEGVHKFIVKERCGVKIGIIGLVEQDWIATIPSWPEHFKYRDMKETALDLSKELRDPNGPHQVDMIIALTHCRVTNDITLANELKATVGQDNRDSHGVDCLIGGHDHMYYIGQGAKEWQGFRGDPKMRGAEQDKYICLIKSGTDFRDLSEALFELEDTPEGSIRRKVVKRLSGKHHEITPETPTSEGIETLVKSLLSTVSDALSKPVCFSLTPFDVRSEIVRTEETAIGNWVADILMHAYSERLSDIQDDQADQGIKSGEADAVIVCAGGFRADSVYPAGKITLGDVLEILPFDDPVVCLDMDGQSVIDVLENGLSKWPAQEGRFPIVAGIQVQWDHTKPPGQRVISAHLLQSPSSDEEDSEDGYEDPQDFVNFYETEDGTRIEVKQKRAVVGEEIKREKGGRMYRIITRNYMAEGYDGFGAFKGHKFVIDDDNGQIMSSIVRSFLLGSAYIFRHKQLRDEHKRHLSSHSDKVLSRHRARFASNDSEGSPVNSPTINHHSPKINHMSPAWSNGNISASGASGRHVVDHASREIRDALHLARHEHMSEMDAIDGKSLRNLTTANCGPDNESVGKTTVRNGPPSQPTDIKATYLVNEHNRDEVKNLDDEIAIVSPLIDGRLKDVSADQH